MMSDGQVIDLTRQLSTDGNSIQDYIEKFISCQLLSQRISSDEYEQDPNSSKEILEFLRNSFGQISSAKLKLLLHENPNFITILLQNLSFFKYDSLISSSTSVVKDFEIFNLTLECFLSILNALENYLFIIIPQEAKDALEEFTSILSSCVASRKNDAVVPLEHCKTIIFTFRILTLLFLILDDNQQPDSVNSEDGHILVSLKENYFENISHITTILSSSSLSSELYGRTFALTLQKYSYKLVSKIISDLHVYCLQFLKSTVGKNKKTIHEELRNLRSIQEYNKLLTVCCFHEKILCHPIIIQCLLKCHAAICSFLLISVVNTHASLNTMESSNKTGHASIPLTSPQKSAGIPTQKNTLSSYYPVKNNNPQQDNSGNLQFSIKKRNYDEFSSANESAAHHKHKIEEISSIFSELFDLEHDLISSFLFQLYLSIVNSLSASSTGNVAWKYNYSARSFPQLITIFIPFLLIPYSSLKKVSRHLLLLLLCHYHQQMNLFSPPNNLVLLSKSQESLLNKEIPSLQMIFSLAPTKISHANSANYRTNHFISLLQGISMILNDETMGNYYLEHIHSDGRNREDEYFSTNDKEKNEDYEMKQRKLIIKSFPELLELLLTFYNYFSSKLIANSVSEEQKDEFSEFEKELINLIKTLISWKYVIRNNLTFSNLCIQAMKNGLKEAVKLIPAEVVSASLGAAGGKVITTAKKQEIVIHEDIDDMFANLEEEEQTKLNPYRLTHEQLKKRQRIYGVEEEEKEFEDKQRQWISAKTPAEKLATQLKQYRPTQQQQEQQHSTRQLPQSLIAKSGVVSDKDWERQKDKLKHDKEMARKKFLENQQSSKTNAMEEVTSPFTLKKKFSSSFITMDENPFDDQQRNKFISEHDVAAVQLPEKQPVMLLDIHSYMKKDDEKDKENKQQRKKELSAEEKNLLEARRIMEMISRDVYYQQKNIYLDEKIGDSILSISVDPICKEIVNFSLPKLLKEQIEEDSKRSLQYQQQFSSTTVPKDVPKSKEVEEGEEPETEGDENEKGKQKFEALPVRFNTTDQYINAYQPLLIEEFKAALISVLINEDNNQTQGNHAFRYQSEDKDKEFREIYYKSELIVIKPNDSSLMEAQISLDYQYYDNSSNAANNTNSNSNSNNNNNNNSNKNFSHRNLYQYELQKDELVLIFRNTFPKGTARNHFFSFFTSLMFFS
jgi:hypothetical protein